MSQKGVRQRRLTFEDRKRERGLREGRGKVERGVKEGTEENTLRKCTEGKEGSGRGQSPSL